MAKKTTSDETENLTDAKVNTFIDQFSAIERQLKSSLIAVARMKEILKERAKERVKR